MARTKRASIVDEPDTEAPTPPAKVREGLPSILSGWCMTGYHRPTSQSVGCKQSFSSFTCPCPCHDPEHAQDSRYDSPEPVHHGADDWD